jgi:hypothetical protein
MTHSWGSHQEVEEDPDLVITTVEPVSAEHDWRMSGLGARSRVGWHRWLAVEDYQR